MSKEDIGEPNRAELVWLDWFHTLKLNKPRPLIIFFTVLSDFVDQYPDIASSLTVEDLHAILLDTI